MDEEIARQLALAAGLHLALELFPDDVLAAAAQVAKQREALKDNFGPADEPWPPMQVPKR
jgi:hypothetical protein